MATEHATDTARQGAEQSAPPNSGGKRAVLVLALAGLAVGTPAGLFGIAPLLAGLHNTEPVEATAPEIASSAVTHAIENLALNPAGTGGNRFLMLTVAFELRNAGIDQMMKDREEETRDRILGVLGRKTVEELSDITKRDAIKRDVLNAVAPLFPKGAVIKVFFPQFVIQ